MATWAVTTSAASLEFDTRNGYHNSCCQIDSNHFINFWRNFDGTNNNGAVQVFEVNTSTWAVTTSAALLKFDATTAISKGAVVKVDANHFLYFWSGVDDDGFVQTFTVNTSTWAVTTAAASLEFDTTNNYANSCLQIDSNHFINFWAGETNHGYVQVFEVNTSTWAVATSAAWLKFDGTAGGFNASCQIDANHFVNAWRGTDKDGFIGVFTVNTSTWVVTTSNSALEFDTTNYEAGSMKKIDDTHVILYWAGASDDGFAQVFTVNTSTWAITTSAASLEYDTTNGTSVCCYAVDSNHFITYWSGSSDDGFVQTFTVNTSTWVVTTASATLEYDTTFNSANSCLQIDSNHFINFWAGASDDGFAQVYTVELPVTDTSKFFQLI